MSLDNPGQPQIRAEGDFVDFCENAPLPLHCAGSDERILWVNQAEPDMLGYSREEYVGHHVTEFHVDQRVIEELLRRLTHSESVQDYEARLRCKDGSIKNVMMTSNVLRDHGQVVHTRCSRATSQSSKGRRLNASVTHCRFSLSRTKAFL